jgi:hypothetical protein
MPTEQSTAGVIQQQASDLCLLPSVRLSGRSDLPIGMEQAVSGVAELLARPPVNLPDGVDSALLPVGRASDTAAERRYGWSNRRRGYRRDSSLQ